MASATSMAIPSTTMPIADLDELLELAGPAAQQASEQLRLALGHLEEVCLAAEVVPADLEALIDPLDRFGAAVEPLRSQTSPILRALLYQEFESQALLLTDCGATAEPGPDHETLVVTGRVTAALDRYYGRMNSGRDSTASGIWGNRDRLFAASWIRDLLASGSTLDVLVVGSSVPKRAYDPAQLSAGLGRVAGNAGAGGSTPEMMAPWLDEIRSTVQPSTIIWGISGSDLYGYCMVEERLVAYEESARNRRQGFAPLVNGPQPGWTHLLGPIDATSYADTLILDTAFTDYEPGTRGRSVNLERPLRKTIDRLMGVHAAELAAADLCVARFAAFNDALTALVADGVEVIVVALPMLDELAAMHPDGVSGPQEELAGVGGSLPVGVRFLDHSAPLDDELFADTFHVTEVGRALLTDRLIEDLTGD
ncbi:MAG: hypothetical protein OEW42_03615 [Acidimicrobiia bacterium]|nr:hypothetical protein [Acidimicrobiia bacterium]